MARLTENRTAMVVEDHHLMAIDIEQALRDEGYDQIVTVASLSAALTAVDDLSPDLVTVDIALLNRDSAPLETLLAARGTPFMYVTGIGPMIVDIRGRPG